MYLITCSFALIHLAMKTVDADVGIFHCLELWNDFAEEINTSASTKVDHDFKLTVSFDKGD